MANLTKLDFIALDVSGTNYLSWVLDAELHLTSNKFGETIKENTTASEQDCAKAMILHPHHLHESLKSQYLTVKSSSQLWKSLKDRFGHQKIVILPRARYEWIQLRLQDFKMITEYNSEMFRIFKIEGSGQYHGLPWGHSYGHGRGHGARGRGRGNGHGNHHNTWINPNIQKKNGNKANNQQEKTTNGVICHRCGMSGHWSRTYHTAQHLVKFYQASLKIKGKEVETNFVEARISDNTHIDASDFFQSIENDDKDLPELPLQFGDILEDFNMLVD
ncbi:UNVERIFIED_CONTAM: hypothetical protein Sradi_5829800 [Sesamum radiatum]|uniref:Uncharacterized protein n=1 Tax=Sesamum radiatum TaxID=300843 RepID=A0AAW2KS64_SESRA